MQSALYVGLSAQVALEKRLQTIANNVANMTTAGFRADAVKFETALSRAASKSVAFASPGENYISRRTALATQTGNALDVAVIGQGWLAFGGPGGPVYTRDGRMQINGEGQLQTLTGYPVLDAGGAPMMVDANGGPLTIGRDGTIQQDGNRVGQIGVFNIPNEAKLQRFANSGVITDRPAEPLLDFVNAGVQQGHVEGSNVDPMLELTRLITTSRTFESASSLVEKSEGAAENAIRTLGEPAKV